MVKLLYYAQCLRSYIQGTVASHECRFPTIHLLKYDKYFLIEHFIPFQHVLLQHPPKSLHEDLGLKMLLILYFQKKKSL